MQPTMTLSFNVDCAIPSLVGFFSISGGKGVLDIGGTKNGVKRVSRKDREQRGGKKGTSNRAYAGRTMVKKTWGTVFPAKKSRKRKGWGDVFSLQKKENCIRLIIVL